MQRAYFPFLCVSTIEITFLYPLCLIEKDGKGKETKMMPARRHIRLYVMYVCMLHSLVNSLLCRCTAYGQSAHSSNEYKAGFLLLLMFPAGRAARLDVRRAQLEGDVQRAAVAARDRDAALKVFLFSLLFVNLSISPLRILTKV